MLPSSCQMALKEWAESVEALGQGEQKLLLRKGGIHEDGKDFRVIHSEFLLYPPYEHQKAELLQPAHQPARDRQDNVHPFRQGRGSAGDLRPREGRRPRTPPHLDNRLRPVPATLEAHAATFGDAAAHLPVGVAGDGAVASRVRWLHVLGGGYYRCPVRPVRIGLGGCGFPAKSGRDKRKPWSGSSCGLVRQIATIRSQ